MNNIKLIIEYDGTEYQGWQRQNSGPTVQGTIEEALGKITNQQIVLLGSGRTDSGVHAMAQVANFKTNSAIEPRNIMQGLNSILPDDITIKDAAGVEDNFHAQFSAKKKSYIYKILYRPYPTSLLRKRVWHIPYEMDLGLMKEAAELISGEHDFNAFAQAGSTVSSTVRHVYSAGFIDYQDDILVFRIEANGFLKRMVRLLVGTLVQVGKGRLSVDGFSELIRSGDKTPQLFAAPPWGLYLEQVTY